METKTKLAFDALNEYDYGENREKSAQDALWLISQMKDIFSEKKVKVSREVATALDFLREIEDDTDELYLRLGSILFNQSACVPDEHMELLNVLYKCKERDLFNAIQYGYEIDT